VPNPVGTRSKVLKMVFLALKTFNLVKNLYKSFDLMPKLTKTFDLVVRSSAIQSIDHFPI
jgi:hypothetical protein